MAVILRVDVDKPYGKHTLIRKIASKIKEDFFPGFHVEYGYLTHLKEFVQFCNSENIIGHFYHRVCTSPDPETIELYKTGKHILGLHLENSKSKLTLVKEINLLRNRVPGHTINSFSKHGSGIHKLGKYHYLLYEPDKYKTWAKELSIYFPSGNGTPDRDHDLLNKNGWFECVFWVEPYLRNPGFNQVEQLIELAKKNDIVILIHPCNYIADKHTRTDFQRLVLRTKEEGIGWKYF